MKSRVGLEFRILGQLEALRDGRPLDLGGGRQRALLALLILRANEALSADFLIDALWGLAPPPTAPKIIQNSVSRLRRQLEPGPGAAAQRQQVLATRASGYELRVDPDAIDAN